MSQLKLNLKKLSSSSSPRKQSKPQKLSADKKRPKRQMPALGKIHFNRASIKTKIIIAFICFALVPFISLCLIYTYVSKNALRTTSSTLNMEVVHQATNNLNTQINNTEQGLVDFGANSILKSGYFKGLLSTNKSEKAGAMLGLNNVISAYRTSQSSITDVALLLRDGSASLGSISPLSSDELLTFLNDADSSKFIWEKNDKIVSSYVVVAKTFTDITLNKAYYVAGKYNLTNFNKYLSGLTLLKDSKVYLVTSKGALLYSTDQDATELPSHISKQLNLEEEQISFNSSNYLISGDTLSNGWKLIVQTPSSSLTEQLDAALIVIIFLLIITMILAVVLGFIYANSFAKPIIRLMELMAKAEQGDLTVEATVKGKDEVAQLCSSFNHMMTNMKQLINQTQDVITHTLSSSETLSQSTNHSVTTIQELATAVNEIAQGTTTQALDAQKSTQDMQGLSEKMDTVSDKTSTLLSNTEGAKSMIENATTVIQSLTNTMSSSLHMTNDICTSIDELNVLNRNIEDIMKLVDGISEQTNLLALNASIEAARVGDAGRGFAVVANEVRQLSDQSKASTVSVRSTLATIDQKMKETVSLAQNSKHIIGDQEKVVEDTDKLFRQIVEILVSMVDELNDISHSVKEMRGFKEVMVSQIDSIASVTQESAASTEEVSSLATEQQTLMTQLSTLSTQLTQNMEQLNQTINTFKVNQ